jgi:hypothetical protein
VGWGVRESTMHSGTVVIRSHRRSSTISFRLRGERLSRCRRPCPAGGDHADFDGPVGWRKGLGGAGDRAGLAPRGERWAGAMACSSPARERDDVLWLREWAMMGLDVFHVWAAMAAAGWGCSDDAGCWRGEERDGDGFRCGRGSAAGQIARTRGGRRTDLADRHGRAGAGQDVAQALALAHVVADLVPGGGLWGHGGEGRGRGGPRRRLLLAGEGSVVGGWGNTTVM